MAQSRKSLALSPREAPTSPQPAAEAARARLWLAVRLPALALESVSDRGDPQRGDPAAAKRSHRRPIAIVEPRRGRLFVVAVDEAARALGVEPGLGLSAAFGFSGSLEIIERSLSAESANLESLAAWCGRLSPAVCIEPPDGLLLEVQGSLRLFGGLSSIKAMLKREMRARGFGTDLAAAPTPLGALWLVRGRRADALSLTQLKSSVLALPLGVAGWPDEVRTLLADMGIMTLGDCLRLPRDGFARRAGVSCLEDLDKALGKIPDPRGSFAAPEHLAFKAELSDQTTDAALLTDAILRMTEKLAMELRARQAQIRSLRLVLEHFRCRATVVRCDLARASHDERRFAELLCDKLERVKLPVPATAVALETGPLEAMHLAKGDLFAARRTAGGDPESPLRLIERLRGRLGPKAVYGLASTADHRPEKAWAKVAEPERPQASSIPCRSAAHYRPLWLLPAAQKLDPGAKPSVDGRLRLVDGPERIESGWWDGEDVGKDYFIARNDSGQRLWIYLDRRRRGWYLHGIFG